MTITNNYLAYNEGNPIMMSDAYAGSPNTQTVMLTDNEIAFTKYAGNTNDAISDIPNGAVIRGNYVHDYVGAPGLRVRRWAKASRSGIRPRTH